MGSVAMETQTYKDGVIVDQWNAWGYFWFYMGDENLCWGWKCKVPKQEGLSQI